MVRMPRPRALVTGHTGFLGPFAVAELSASFDVMTAARSGGDVQADLSDPTAAAAVVAAVQPDFVLWLAANARIADCERDADAARRINAEAPSRMARGLGPRFLYVSTDLVFDGRAAPYAPLDATGPLSAYASTKADGEERVLAEGGRVARLPLLFGPDRAGRGATAMVRNALARGEPLSLFTNEYRTPIHCRDAARALSALLPQTGGPRISHLGGPERVSRWELGQMLCLVHGLPTGLLRPAECQDPLRPRDVSLRSEFACRELGEMLADC
jgi:dTDP-4-dehydrorhamnose reductase